MEKACTDLSFMSGKNKEKLKRCFPAAAVIASDLHFLSFYLCLTWTSQYDYHQHTELFMYCAANYWPKF